MAKNFSRIIEIVGNNTEIGNIFKFNEFTNDIEMIDHAPWGNKGIVKDVDIIETKNYLSKTLEIELNVNIINEVLVILAGRKKYHPIREYLKSVQWDGVRRLDTWLIDVCGVDDCEYVRLAGAKVLIAAVSRVFNPGCQFDYMLILEGQQGKGKSTMLNILGGSWYLDTQFTTSEHKKDIVDIMRTAWIIEIADMAGFKKQDTENLKSFLTRKVDRVRLPYARRAENFPRQSVFIGTHNPSGDNQYLRDDTGNRRFWCVECNGTIKTELMKGIKDQLWAEAYQRYLGKEVLFIESEKALEQLDTLHKDREIDTPLFREIDRYLRPFNYATMDEILEKALQVNIKQVDYLKLRGRMTIVGIFMRKEKWIKGSNEKKHYYFRNDFKHYNYELSELENGLDKSKVSLPTPEPVQGGLYAD